MRAVEDGIHVGVVPLYGLRAGGIDNTSGCLPLCLRIQRVRRGALRVLRWVRALRVRALRIVRGGGVASGLRGVRANPTPSPTGGGGSSRVRLRVLPRHIGAAQLVHAGEQAIGFGVG